MRPLPQKNSLAGTSSAVSCPMRCRLAWLVAGIVALSATSVLADVREDRRIAFEVDGSPLVRVCTGVEVRSLQGSLTPEQLDGFADLAEQAVAGIARFTGVEPPAQRIVIYLSPRVDISHTYPRYPGSWWHEPRVYIDSERVASHSAPYLHELVHAVAGDGGAMWLEEGFASWVASSVATRYGGYYAPVLSAGNDRVDLQARTVIERSRGTNEAGTWFTPEEPQLGSPRERRNFYIVAHSFTKFLAGSLGANCLISIFRANDVEALARLSGVSMDEWRRRWLAGLGEETGVVAVR